jgi:hypothetical protein
MNLLLVLQPQTWIHFAYVPESLVEKVELAIRGVRRVVNQPLILMGPINGSTFNWILWFSSWHTLTACWHGLRDSLPTSFGDTSSQTAPSLSPTYDSCYGKLIPRNLGIWGLTDLDFRCWAGNPCTTNVNPPTTQDIKLAKGLKCSQYQKDCCDYFPLSAICPVIFSPFHA